LTFDIGRHALPWQCLLFLSWSGAYAIRGVVASIDTTTPVMTSSGKLLQRESNSAAMLTKVVTIKFRDAAIGSETELRCRTTGDRVSTDVLLFDIGYRRDVGRALCESE
jgi:hypothetical protein